MRLSPEGASCKDTHKQSNIKHLFVTYQAKGIVPREGTANKKIVIAFSLFYNINDM